ncbi:T9SS type A sorting domain-containing protein [Candidatus Eisenbacteria bacterium]|uniref:T9SS type A sorting domain-containing protein n=1 Tax=Eiseniibacteriota bacterium TaxID=2212470 RepID=A0ABV6YQZ8_UNCEI
MTRSPQILLLVCACCIFPALPALAQGPDTLWTGTYGGASSDYGYSIAQTSPDGGYIVTGSTFSFGEGLYDVYYVKLDANGGVDWSKTYGGSGTEHGTSVKQTLDGGYIITGYTNSSGAGSYDLLLVKTDAAGIVDWAYTYGGSEDDRGYCVQQTVPDSGYIVAGYSDTFGAGGGDAFVVRTDASGGFLWGAPYGGIDWDEARSISQTFPDSGFIITGATSSFGAGGDDAYLIKIDSDGDTLWTRTYGGAGSDYGFEAHQTFPDSGYVMVGHTSSFGAGNSDIYLVKTDQDGDSLWTTTFGGSSVEYGYSVQQTSPEPGYIVSGTTRSFGAGNFDAYVIKTDAVGGPIWTKTYGGTEYDDGYSVCQTAPDSGYVVAGSTRSFGAGIYDIFVVKTEPVLAGVVEKPAGETGLMLSGGEPNPFNDQTLIRYRLGERSRVTIAVHNVLGRKVATLVDAVQSQGTHAVTWDGRDSRGGRLAPGIYFCSIQANDLSATRKVVLMR